MTNTNDFSEEVAFNKTAFLELLGGGEEMIPEFLPLFAETVEEALPNLEAALASDDCQAVAKIAHMIKGAAANICAERLLRTAKELEACGRSGDAAGAGRLKADLISEFRLFQRETESWIK